MKRKLVLFAVIASLILCHGWAAPLALGDGGAQRAFGQQVGANDEETDSRKPPLGWIIVGGVAVALVCGLGKLFLELTQVDPLVQRRKQPWERD
jgi:hypothetical protein